MGENLAREQPKRGRNGEVKELLKALRDLEEDLADMMMDLKNSARQIGLERRPRECVPTNHSTVTTTTDTTTTDTAATCTDSAYDEPCRYPDPGCPPQPKPCGTQLIVNGCLSLPCEKPDAEAILRFIPVCRVTNWQSVHTVDGRKVVVTGVMEVNVEYVAKLTEQPMHFAHFIVPFHTFFICEKPVRDVLCDVEFKHEELIDPRTISHVVLIHVHGIG